MSTDNQKMGIKTPTSSDRLDINLVETGVTSNDVQPIIGIDGRSTIVEYTGDCSSVKATIISTKLINGKTGEEAKEAANIIKTKSDIIYLADAYRYIGSNPNNYVYFNNEIWRIIGVYNNKLKIINTDNEHSIQYNTYDKQWMNDWDDSTVNDWLKNDYYNSLSSIAKEMIEPSSWYIGKANGGENAEEAYNKSKVLTWNGTVGTIAAYEFLYASSPSSCYLISGHNYSGGAYCGRNWIASRSISITMTAYENDQHLACFLYGGNYPSIGVSGVQNHLTVRPVVYLKPSVKILDGEGTNTNPYRLAQ